MTDELVVLTEWTVLSLTAAAKRLPWRTAVALEWLREAGVIRYVCEREVVIWGDVLRKIREAGSSDSAANSTPPAAPIRPPSNLPRADLSGRKQR